MFCLVFPFFDPNIDFTIFVIGDHHPKRKGRQIILPHRPLGIRRTLGHVIPILILDTVIKKRIDPLIGRHSTAILLQDLLHHFRVAVPSVLHIVENISRIQERLQELLRYNG